MKIYKIKNNKGFTLIELIVVIAILGFLATVAVPKVIGVVQRAQVSSTEANRTIIQNAVERYYVDFGKYPQSLDELTKTSKVDGVDYGPYLEEISDDILNSFEINESGKVVEKKGNRE